MQKGRKGTYREFEAHEAEVTLENDKKKEKQEEKKKSGGGEGEICTRCTKSGYKRQQINQLVKKGIHIMKMFLHSP